MFHMLASSSAAVLIMLFCRRPENGLPSPQMLWEWRYAIGPISVCTFLNTALNNKSLTKISLFLNQVIKSLGPFPTMVFSFLVLGTTVSYPVLGSLLGLVGSCARALRRAAVDGHPPSASPHRRHSVAPAPLAFWHVRAAPAAWARGAHSPTLSRAPVSSTLASGERGQIRRRR